MPETTEDLFAPQANASSKRRIYTVSEITQGIKLILEKTFGEVWVEGEISNFRAHPSGHHYFSLKDQGAVLAAVMFSAANRSVKFKIEDGLKVICFGRINCYAPYSQYQIIVQEIEPKGIGSLQLALEQLKQKLEKEGLFKQEHKRQIPYLPKRIGVVTSLSGAAIKDILKVLDRRFSDVNVIINPAKVQGDSAKEEIAGAIKDFNILNNSLPYKQRIEVMIVGRGGGSMEDLWAFNEEVVARAIYNSQIPVISAVGHERDWTIADLVADLRAPTPSVAAELVLPKREDLKEKICYLTDALRQCFLDIASDYQTGLGDFNHRLNISMQSILRLSASELETSKKRLALLNPVVLIQQHKAKIEDLARQAYVRLSHFMKLKQAEFNTAVEKLSGLSPLNILSRGYSIAFKMPEGEIIKDARLVKRGDTIKTRLHNGELLSQVTEVKENGRA